MPRWVAITDQRGCVKEDGRECTVIVDIVVVRAQQLTRRRSLAVGREIGLSDLGLLPPARVI